MVAVVGALRPGPVLALVGFLGIITWLVGDLMGGRVLVWANRVMLGLFVVCVVAAALLR